MAEKPWTTNYPTSQDTGTNGTTQMPDLDDETSPGAEDGDTILSSHLEALRNKVQSLALTVGDDSDAPGGSLKQRVTTLEEGGGGGGGSNYLYEDEFSAAGGTEYRTLTAAPAVAGSAVPSGYEILGVYVDGVKYKYGLSPTTRTYAVEIEGPDFQIGLTGLTPGSDIEVVYRSETPSE